MNNVEKGVDSVDNIKVGMIIKSSNWQEPVEIKTFEDLDEYVKIIGVKTKSKEYFESIISKEEFSKFIIETNDEYFSEESYKVFLGLETVRYKFASLYDPLLAMNTSKVDPLPHQIEAVYNFVLRMPRIRFLIADDPGAGKTIMAG